VIKLIKIRTVGGLMIGETMNIIILEIKTDYREGNNIKGKNRLSAIAVKRHGRK